MISDEGEAPGNRVRVRSAGQPPEGTPLPLCDCPAPPYVWGTAFLPVPAFSYRSQTPPFPFSIAAGVKACDPGSTIRLLVPHFTLEAGTAYDGSVFKPLPGPAGSDNLVKCPGAGTARSVGAAWGQWHLC